MTIVKSNRRVPLVLAILLSCGGLPAGNLALGQTAADSPAAAEKTEPAKPRGRLPLYYASVVTMDQRQQIYSIQTQYAAEIEQLQQQLQALLVKRDAEVEGVLTDEQKTKVQQMRDDAKARRAASRQPAAESSGDGAAR